VSTLPPFAEIVAAAFAFFSALRPQIGATGFAQRLHDAETDAAVAASHHRHAAVQIENAHHHLSRFNCAAQPRRVRWPRH